MSISILTSAAHSLQAALSAYGVYVSYIAITNFQKYEETSKKAAKVSFEAEHRLNKTRTTQASGLVAVLGSLAASIFLATRSDLIPSKYRILASPVMLGFTLLLRGHMHNFWKDKAKVPFMTGYNEALSKTGELIHVLEYLEYSWVSTAVLSVLIGIK